MSDNFYKYFVCSLHIVYTYILYVCTYVLSTIEIDWGTVYPDRSCPDLKAFYRMYALYTVCMYPQCTRMSIQDVRMYVPYPHVNISYRMYHVYMYGMYPQCVRKCSMHDVLYSMSPMLCRMERAK